MSAVGSLVESFIPFMIFAIPIVAIVGGITAGIVKTISESRIIENAQRERLAAIERGLDPSKLPALPGSEGLGRTAEFAVNPDVGAQHRSNGLLIWGLVVLFAGVGTSTFLLISDEGGNDWAIGLVPAFVGVALLLSGYLTRPRPAPRS